MAAGELLIYPQIWVAQSCLLQLVFWDWSVCVCVGGMFSRISRGNGLTFLVDACLSHHEAKMGNS